MMLRAFAVAVILAVLTMFMALAHKAKAHDWYPIECCHALDCAPVDNVSYVAGIKYDAMGNEVANPLPQMLVTTKHGTVLVPKNFPIRESRDNRMHACMRNYNGEMHLFCIFAPPTM